MQTGDIRRMVNAENAGVLFVEGVVRFLDGQDGIFREPPVFSKAGVALSKSEDIDFASFIGHERADGGTSHDEAAYATNHEDLAVVVRLSTQLGESDLATVSICLLQDMRVCLTFDSSFKSLMHGKYGWPTITANTALTDQPLLFLLLGPLNAGLVPPYQYPHIFRLVSQALV